VPSEVISAKNEPTFNVAKVDVNIIPDSPKLKAKKIELEVKKKIENIDESSIQKSP
jgi:hypothetical protein